MNDFLTQDLSAPRIYSIFENPGNAAIWGDMCLGIAIYANIPLQQVGALKTHSPCVDSWYISFEFALLDQDSFSPPAIDYYHHLKR